MVDKKTADLVIDSFSKEIKELSKKFKSRKYFWSFYKKNLTIMNKICFVIGHSGFLGNEIFKFLKKKKISCLWI